MTQPTPSRPTMPRQSTSTTPIRSPHRSRVRLLALVASAMVAGACSVTGGPPPAATGRATLPPVAPSTFEPTPVPWPEDWRGTVCDARASLDGAAADVTQGVDAAANDQATDVAEFATEASMTAERVTDSLDATADWERGRGVTVNLRSAATHLAKAAQQLTSWSEKATAARLKAAKKELASARTNLSRASINQGTLTRTTGFSC